VRGRTGRACNGLWQRHAPPVEFNDRHGEESVPTAPLIESVAGAAIH